MGLKQALLCLVLLVGVAAVYEDQAGEVEWHNTYIGAVKFSELHKSQPKVFAATYSNVVAAVHLRDGSILWRKVLGEADTIHALTQLQKPPAVAVLTDGPTMASGPTLLLRVFDHNTGVLLWDAPIVAPSPSTHAAEGEAAAISMAAADVNQDRSEEIAVVWGSQAVVFGREGRVLLDVAAPLAARARLFSPGPHQLAVHHHTPGAAATLHVAAISCETPRGGAPGACSVQPQWETQVEPGLGELAAWSGGAVFVMGSEPGSMCRVAEGEAAAVCGPAVPVPGSRIAAIHPADGDSVVLQYRGAGAGLLTTADGGRRFELRRAHTAPDAVVSGVVPHPATGQPLGYAVVQAGPEGGLLWEVVGVRDGGVLHTETVPRQGGGGVAAAALGAFVKRAGGEGFRLLISCKDQALSLLQQEQELWVREEALASVVSTVWVDLPAAGVVSREGGLGKPPSLGDSLRLQLLSLKAQLNLHTPEEQQQLQDLKRLLSKKGLPHQDTNGMRRMILALTASGKLFALHNGFGSILWGLQLAPPPATPLPPAALHPHTLGAAPGLAPLPGSVGAAQLLPSRLLAWTVSHDVARSPTVLALGVGGGTVVDAWHGTVVGTAPLPAGVAAVRDVRALSTRVPTQSADEQCVYVLTGSAADGREAAALFPPSPGAAQELTSQDRNLFYWSLRNNTLQGWALQAGAAPGALEVSLAWSIAPQEPVLAAAAKDPAAPLHSHIKVAGDRSFKIKEVSPNLLLLVTGPPTPADAPGASPLTAFIVNTVTGRVLYSQAHPGASGPVHAVFCEHWVVYHYWSATAHRWAVSVVELYSPLGPLEGLGVWALMSGNTPNATHSAYEGTAPQVLRQEFIARTPVRGMATTYTASGITSKQLLMITESDQVYGLDQKMLDPKRPRTTKLTPAQKEERLPPYQTQLPLHGPHYISLDKQVARVSAVSVEPAFLESTCLVLAYGLDMFHTRLTPSKAFDSLDDNFAYGLLVAALGAMAAGTAVLNHMTKSTKLKSQWK